MSSDPRFARLHTDPRFVRPKAAKNKIVVDKRFESIFKDEDEGSKQQRKVDKYGRKVEKDNKSLELKRYYRMEEEEEQRDKKAAPTKEDVVGEQEDEEEGDESESDDEEKTGGAAKPFVDLARGQVLMESSDEEGDKDDKDDEDEDEDESDSEVGSSGDEGSVTFGGITKSGLRRRPKSPSIDLSETEHALAGSDNEVGEGEDDDDQDQPDPTKRLAVVNMDWDNIRAVDLYRVLASPLSATAASIAETSTASGSRATAGAAKKFDERGEEVEGFKPSSRLVIAPGRLLHLRIYPSQFGRERMEREAREGPPTEVFKAAQAAASDSEEGEGNLLVLGRQKNKGKTKAQKSKKRRGDDSDDESEDDVAITEQDVVRDQVEDGEEEYDHEALRKYQLERLRYYYAIATFDSAASAAHVHDQILGTEFEHTANFFDLQYVPDETSFEDDPVHDEATEATVASEGTSYTGINFVTDVSGFSVANRVKIQRELIAFAFGYLQALRHSKVKLTWDADDPHRKTKIQSYLAAAMDPKGKGKGLANDEGVRAYLASSSDDDGEGEEAEEVDDFFEAEGYDNKQGKDKRSKLRSLFGLDGEVEEQTWDGGRGTDKKGADGGMQITFASALSTKKAKKGQDDSDDEQDRRAEETAIETYKRKEKERRERKRLERKAKRDGVTLPAEGEEGPEFGGKNTGPGGFDDAFFADGGKDPFAAYDEGMESGDEIGQPKNAKGKRKDEANGKLSKREKREAKEREEEEAKKSQASLELLVASDNDEDGAKHFDMRNIIKAEKTSGKRNRHKKKGKKGAAEEPQVEDSFKIDLKDDRFKSLHEDHEFAIDPTNPRFQKTRNMDALLTEGRKRRSNKLDARAPVNAPPLESVKQASKQSKESENLQQLVESVKRKAGDVGGRGKRSKTDSA